MGKIVDALLEYLILDSEPRGDGKPHLEIDCQGYHFVSSERGEEFERLVTKDLDELLYWVFNSIIFQIAVTHEYKNRVENQDFRKDVFKKQLELFKIIDIRFYTNRKEEIAKALESNTYRDE